MNVWQYADALRTSHWMFLLGEWKNFTSQLPKDYADLLGTEPVEKH